MLYLSSLQRKKRLVYFLTLRSGSSLCRILPRVVQRFRQPAPPWADVRPQRVGHGPPARRGHRPGARQRERALPDLRRDRALATASLAGGGPGVRGEDRLPRGALAGQVLARGHGAPDPARARPVPVSQGDRLQVLLPRLGRDVQASRPPSTASARGSTPSPSCSSGCAASTSWTSSRRPTAGRPWRRRLPGRASGSPRRRWPTSLASSWIPRSGGGGGTGGGETGATGRGDASPAARARAGTDDPARPADRATAAGVCPDQSPVFRNPPSGTRGRAGALASRPEPAVPGGASRGPTRDGRPGGREGRPTRAGGGTGGGQTGRPARVSSSWGAAPAPAASSGPHRQVAEVPVRTRSGRAVG